MGMDVVSQHVWFSPWPSTHSKGEPFAMGKPGPLSSQGMVRRLPSAYRLLPDLERSSLSSIEEGLADRWTFREAFRRGATEFDATKLILARLSARRRRGALDAQNVGLGRLALGQR